MTTFLLTLVMVFSTRHHVGSFPLCTPRHHAAPCVASGDNEPTVPAYCVTGTSKQRARKECDHYSDIE